MTELQALLTFLLNIAHRYPVKADCERIQNMLKHVYLEKDKVCFENFLTSLMRLDDAIVVGLNTGRFEWKEHGAFSLYPHSALPKFLRGVLSKVFDDEGNLKTDYTELDMAAIEGLRLVRRTQFPEMEEKAHKKAIKTFVDFQRQVRFADSAVVNDMQQLWAFFAPESRFRDNLQLGFPGPGAMHSIEYPHVPQLTFVDHNTIPDPLVSGIMRDALALKLQTIACSGEFPDCSFVNVYPFKRGIRISTGVTVPKTCLVKRFITITDPDAVCIGATARVTLFNVARSWNWLNVCNVHDQKISHKTLLEDFETTSYTDLEGGTGCLKLDVMYDILPSYLTSMLKASKSDYFSYDENPVVNRPFHIKDKKALSKELKAIYDKIDICGIAPYQPFEDPDLPIEPIDNLVGVEKITTLAQGDASSVALLTITLALALALAVYYTDYCYDDYSPPELLPLDHDRFTEIAAFMQLDGRFHVVGDDLVYPSKYEEAVRFVLAGLGVTINERKSSSQFARHKETCGAWVVMLPDGKKKSIFPFRHPDKQNLAHTRMHATQEFIQRSLKSANSLELAMAVLASVPFDYLEEYESYELSSVGTPFGIKPASFKYHTEAGPPSELPDELAYTFGIDPEKFFPSYSSKERALAVGFRPIKDSPHPLFLSFGRAIKRCTTGTFQKRASVNTIRTERWISLHGQIVPKETFHFILSLLHVSQAVLLFEYFVVAEST